MKNKKFTFTFTSKLSSSLDTSDLSPIYTNAEQEPVLEIEPSYELEPIDFLESQHIPEQTDSSIDIQPPITYQVFNWELEPISEDDNPPQPTRQQLSAEERRKIRNRSTTLKQRKRYYPYELIFINFDRRFKIRYIKKILREHDILFTAVNILKSTITGRKILHVGIKEPTKLEEYQYITQDFFNTNHFYAFNRKYRQRYS